VRGAGVEFKVRVLPPRLPWLKWKAAISYRVHDDEDLFLCPWMDYQLHLFGGGIGYACATWTRSGLDIRVQRIKAEILGWDRWEMQPA
jgi:hypothetical protein